MKLLIVGNRGGTNIGESLWRAALKLGLETHLVDTRLAMIAPMALRQLNWRFRGHRPTWLGRFSDQLVCCVNEMRPDCLLTTGQAPIRREALVQIGLLGVTRINFLTDDPWNPAHLAPWFLKALPAYDNVFSPRRANLHDLAGLGCSQISYLPFGYDSDLFYPEETNGAQQDNLGAEVIFAGGADYDRVPYVSALITAGFDVALHGDYWERFPETKAAGRGHADPATLRRAIGAAKVALCLVRHANRDGNSMRTFEVPAIGACMLVEDTEEHHEIFGGEMSAVAYFKGIDEMIEKLRWLLEHEEERKRMALAAHQLITTGRNTYQDRLLTMLYNNNGGSVA